MTQLLRVHNFMLSRDGFGAGLNQCFERPFGDADQAALFAWVGATASWVNRTDPGGSRGLDDYFTRDFANNIGAEIMGRNKFSPYRGPWQDQPDWQGWWGEEPPGRGSGSHRRTSTTGSIMRWCPARVVSPIICSGGDEGLRHVGGRA